MQQNSRKSALSSPLFGLLTVIAAVTLTSIIAWVLYNHTVNLLTRNLRERLLSIVTTAVIQIEPDDIAALKQEVDWQKPEWRRVVGQLAKIKANNKDILFVYIFRKNPSNQSEMEFVADAGSINPYANVDGDPSNDVDVDSNGVIDDIDYLQWPGQPYPEPPADSWKAFSGALTNSELYEDAWGKVITGYAPILDESGQAIAVLAVDIRATEFFAITTQTLVPFLGFIVFLIFIICSLAWGLIRIWNKRVELVVELDQQKDELLSMVTHQLATPISSIKWYVEMLIDGDMGKLSKEQEEQLQTVQGVAGNLSELVTMILDVSRLQLGRMKVEKCDLNLSEFFGEVFAVISPKANEKKVNLEWSVPQELPGAKLDKRLTRMTVENLLSNAVKYTPTGGNVHFSVKISQQSISCVVRDTGCGIPKAEHGKIFGKLYRASNVRNAVDGNGFGLYVAKGAIEAQGGQIRFESEVGQGTTFYFELPLA